MLRNNKNIIKNIFKVFGSILAFLLVFIGILFIVALINSSGKIEQFTDNSGNVLSKSLSEKKYIEIGGIQQGMFIRSKNIDNPVLLFLHGGPGSPAFADYQSVYNDNAEILEDYFTVCWWEQRGAGLSYNPGISPESMTIDQIMSDTVEVTNYLRSRFGKDKIYLMGHSWGTLLGTNVVAKNPDLYEAYIGIGQYSNALESEKLGYDFMLKKSKELGDKKSEEKLLQYKINTPNDLTTEYMGFRSQLLNKYGVGITHVMGNSLKSMVDFMMYKPYTFSQKLNQFKGGSYSVMKLWEPMMSQNLEKSLIKFKVPIYIMNGKYDHMTSTEMAKDYFEVLKAPKKQFYIFENSAHSPHLEEKDKFMKIIKEDVLGLVKK